MDNWIDSYKEKPPTAVIVHGICRVGDRLDVVECWWSDKKWIIPSVRSKIPLNHIFYWKSKPKIPQYIIEKIRKQ